MNQKGHFYIEVLISIALIGFLGITILPSLKRLLTRTSDALIHRRLVSAASYVGDYVLRWADSEYKENSIESFSDGDELEGIERRISQLTRGETGDTFSDYYKCHIQFYDTSSRSKSAVVGVKVWYDSDLDSSIDLSEQRIEFSTIVTEKYH